MALILNVTRSYLNMVERRERQLPLKADLILSDIAAAVRTTESQPIPAMATRLFASITAKDPTPPASRPETADT